MNVAYIVLGVAVVIVLYLLYLYIFWGTATLASFLNCTVNSVPIAGSALVNPTSINYTYGIWVYVQSWQTSGGSNAYTSTNSPYMNIFYRNGPTGYSTIHVYLSAQSPTLYVDFFDGTKATPLQSPAASATSTANRILVTQNFPLQKWVCVVASYDSGNCDIYLDGKMVTTAVISNNITAQPDVNSGVTCGPFGGFIGNFTNWASPINPQSVWNFYLKGNGQSLLGNTYGMQVNLLNNGQVSQSMQMF